MPFLEILEDLSFFSGRIGLVEPCVAVLCPNTIVLTNSVMKNCFDVIVSSLIEASENFGADTRYVVNGLVFLTTYPVRWIYRCKILHPWIEYLSLVSLSL